jgi:nucleoside-diphosphate-sugar epimerase
MNIIVTGASGFVGGHLIQALAAGGHRGVAVSRKAISSLPAGWQWKERKQMLKERPPAATDWVIHLEVKQHTQNPTAEDLKQFQTVNVDGVREWLDFAGSHGITRFLHFSTIKAVGDSLSMQTEADRSEPNTPYGKSKLAGENEARNWAAQTKGRSVVILRPAVVYGPGNQANILSLIQAIDKGRFFLVGKNDNVKSLVSMNNLTAAVLYLLTSNASLRMQASPPGAASKEQGAVDLFYVTDHQSYSVAEIARMIQKGLGKKGAIMSLPVPVAKAGALAGDIITKMTGKGFPLTSNRLRALLETTHFSSKKLEEAGFKHPETTEQGLKWMMEWHISGREKW